MSRTYRTGTIDLDFDCKPLPYGKTWWDLLPSRSCIGYSYKMDYRSKRNQQWDRKHQYKPPKAFKRLNARARRAKEKEAMAHHRYNDIPRLRKTDTWEWT